MVRIRRLLKRKPGTRRRLPESTVLRCPMEGYRATWCRATCRPIDGKGLCGRPAPHGLMGRTQRAILEYRNSQKVRDGESERS